MGSYLLRLSPEAPNPTASTSTIFAAAETRGFVMGSDME